MRLFIFILLNVNFVKTFEICDSIQQRLLDSGCCGEDQQSVCVSPNLDLSNVGVTSDKIKNIFTSEQLQMFDMTGTILRVNHGKYRAHRMQTYYDQQSGFAAEFLFFLHKLTNATIIVSNNFTSPELDTTTALFLGRKDTIPARLDADHLFYHLHAAPSTSAIHYLLVRKNEVTEFNALLSGTEDMTPMERVGVLLSAGKKVATCNCEQYLTWIDCGPNGACYDINPDNSYIFGAFGNTPIENYDEQWWSMVSIGVADFTFLDDHLATNLDLIPNNLEIIKIEMAERSEQVLFGNKFIPKLEEATKLLLKLGLYDYSFSRWKNVWRNIEKNEMLQTFRDNLVPRNAQVQIDSETFSFADSIIKFANIPTSDYILGNGEKLEGFVQRDFSTFIGTGSTVSMSPPPPPPQPPSPPPRPRSPPLPPNPPTSPPSPPFVPGLSPPPYSRPQASPPPSPPEFCEDCELGRRE